MSASKIAKRYSKALINLCNKDQSHDKTAQALGRFVGVLKDHVDIAAALSSPAIDGDVRKKVLVKILADLSISGLVHNFLLFVGDKERMGEIGGIHEDFLDRLDELSGRVRATVTSATPLSAAETKEIQASLERTTKKTVVLETLVDPSLMGGVVTRVGNLVLDGSIKTALGSMRERLLNSAQ